MSTTDPIDEFLFQLQAALSRYRLIGPRWRRRILLEVESHLRESAEAIRAAGWSRAEAEQEAVRRFGRADELAKQWADINQERAQSMLKSFIGTLAGVTTLCALFVVGHTLAVPEGSLLWIGTKFLIGGVTVLQGILTLFYLGISGISRQTLTLGAIGLLSLGFIVTGAGSYEALQGADAEYWVVMLGLIMILQACATIVDVGKLPWKIA